MTNSLESSVLLLLTQLIVIIAAAQVGGWLFRRLGQPQVVGEILAGLCLGPSGLAWIFPDFVGSLFPREGDLILRILGQIGLVFLMLDVGLSFDFSHLSKVKGAAVGVAAAGIVLPFSLGMALAYVMAPAIAADYPLLPLALFVATAISITAIPILGRIMMDLEMQDTPVGVLIITAAAVDDAIGWIVLAIVSGLVAGGFVWINAVWQLLGLTAFLIFSFAIVRPIAERYSSRLNWNSVERGPGLMALLTLGTFLFAMVTNLIGVFSVFGPFVFGACLSQRPEIKAFYKRSAAPLVAALFLPAFFTFTGLRTDVGSLDAAGWFWCGGVFVVACVGKMFGCAMVTKWAGYSWKESATVALLMNTRALMGLVAINVGRELGAIPDSVFTILVIMAIATTVMTVPLLKLIRN